MLEGQTALVTGASRGIGRACALELAAHGAAIAVNYNTSRDAAEEVVREIEFAGGRAMALQADVSDAAQCRRLYEEAVAAFGQVDILVNNAGIARPRMVHRMEVEDWDAVIAANLSSAFYLINLASKDMRERRFGRIVNIASTLGQMPGLGAANYSASKGGMIALTRAVALELAPFNVTVNAVCPGWIQTDLNARITEEQWQGILKGIPLGRVGTVEDIARMVRFVVTEGDWITGQQLNVNGGEHM